MAVGIGVFLAVVIGDFPATTFVDMRMFDIPLPPEGVLTVFPNKQYNLISHY